VPLTRYAGQSLPLNQTDRLSFRGGIALNVGLRHGDAPLFLSVLKRMDLPALKDTTAAEHGQIKPTLDHKLCEVPSQADSVPGSNHNPLDFIQRGFIVRAVIQPRGLRGGMGGNRPCVL
jgi:hypothetical protein